MATFAELLAQQGNTNLGNLALNQPDEVVRQELTPEQLQPPTSLRSIVPFGAPRSPDELRSLQAQERVRQAAVDEDALGFWSKLKEQFARGDIRGDFQRNIARAYKDNDIQSANELLRLKKEYESLTARNPVEADNLLANWTLQAAQSASGTARGMASYFLTEALSSAAIGAGSALIAGQLGPQAAAPEEAVTVPVAATAGGIKGIFSAARAWKKAGTLTRGFNVSRPVRSLLPGGEAARAAYAANKAQAAANFRTALSQAGIIDNVLPVGSQAAMTALTRRAQVANSVSGMLSAVVMGSQFMEQGEGELYASLAEKGWNPERAKAVAPIAGALYGMVESFESFMPVARGWDFAVQQKFKQKVKDKIGSAIVTTFASLATKHGIDTVQESLEEYGQALITGGAEALVINQALDGRPIQDVAIEFEQVLDDNIIKAFEEEPELRTTGIGELFSDGFRQFQAALGPSFILAGAGTAISAPGEYRDAKVRGPRSFKDEVASWEEMYKQVQGGTELQRLAAIEQLAIHNEWDDTAKSTAQRMADVKSLALSKDQAEAKRIIGEYAPDYRHKKNASMKKVNQMAKDINILLEEKGLETRFANGKELLQFMGMLPAEEEAVEEVQTVAERVKNAKLNEEDAILNREYEALDYRGMQALFDAFKIEMPEDATKSSMFEQFSALVEEKGVNKVAKQFDKIRSDQEAARIARENELKKAPEQRIEENYTRLEQRLFGDITQDPEERTKRRSYIQGYISGGEGQLQLGLDTEEDQQLLLNLREAQDEQTAAREAKYQATMEKELQARNNTIRKIMDGKPVTPKDLAALEDNVYRSEVEIAAAEIARDIQDPEGLKSAVEALREESAELTGENAEKAAKVILLLQRRIAKLEASPVSEDHAKAVKEGAVPPLQPEPVAESKEEAAARMGKKKADILAEKKKSEKEQSSQPELPTAEDVVTDKEKKELDKLAKEALKLRERKREIQDDASRAAATERENIDRRLRKIDERTSDIGGQVSDRALLKYNERRNASITTQSPAREKAEGYKGSQGAARYANRYSLSFLDFIIENIRRPDVNPDSRYYLGSRLSMSNKRAPIRQLESLQARLEAARAGEPDVNGEVENPAAIEAEIQAVVESVKGVESSLSSLGVSEEDFASILEAMFAHVIVQRTDNGDVFLEFNWQNIAGSLRDKGVIEDFHIITNAPSSVKDVRKAKSSKSAKALSLPGVRFSDGFNYAKMLITREGKDITDEQLKDVWERSLRILRASKGSKRTNLARLAGEALEAGEREQWAVYSTMLKELNDKALLQRLRGSFNAIAREAEADARLRGERDILRQEYTDILPKAPHDKAVETLGMTENTPPPDRKLSDVQRTAMEAERVRNSLPYSASEAYVVLTDVYRRLLGMANTKDQQVEKELNDLLNQTMEYSSRLNAEAYSEKLLADAKFVQKLTNELYSRYVKGLHLSQSQRESVENLPEQEEQDGLTQLRPLLPTQPLTTIEAIAAEMKKAFPQAQFAERDGRYFLTFGEHQVEITLAEHELGMRDGQYIGGLFYPAGQRITEDGVERANEQDLIALSKVSSDVTTVRKEVMRWILERMVSPEDRQRLIDALPAEVGEDWAGPIAAAYETWTPSPPKTFIQRIFEKIRRFAQMIGLVPVTSEERMKALQDSIFGQVASGTVPGGENAVQPPSSAPTALIPTRDEAIKMPFYELRPLMVAAGVPKDQLKSKRDIINNVYETLQTPGRATMDPILEEIRQRDPDKGIYSRIETDKRWNPIKTASIWGRKIAFEYPTSTRTRVVVLSGHNPNSPLYKSFEDVEKGNKKRALAKQEMTDAYEAHVTDEVKTRLRSKLYPGKLGQGKTDGSVVTLNGESFWMKHVEQLKLALMLDDAEAMDALKNAKSLTIHEKFAGLERFFKKLENVNSDLIENEVRAIAANVKSDPDLHAAFKGIQAMNEVGGRLAKEAVDELLIDLYRSGARFKIGDKDVESEAELLQALGRSDPLLEADLTEAKKNLEKTPLEGELSVFPDIISPFRQVKNHSTIHVLKYDFGPSSDQWLQYLTNSYLLKVRTGAKGQDILIPDALEEMAGQIEVISNVYGMMLPLFRFRKIVNDANFRNEVVRKMGQPFYDQLREGLDIMDGRKGPNTKSQRQLDAAMRQLVHRTTISGLVSAFTGMKMMLSHPLAISRMHNPSAALQVPTMRVSNAEREYMENSWMWKDRYKYGLRQDPTLEASAALARAEHLAGKRTISAAALQVPSFFDRKAIRWLWKYAKADVLADNPSLTGQKLWEATEDRWVELIRHTQPISDRSQVAYILADNSGLKRGFMFYGQRAQIVNMVYEAWDKFSQAKTIEEKRAAAAHLTAVATNVLFVNASIMAVIGITRRAYKDVIARMWGDDDEPEKGDILEQYAQELRNNTLGLVPGVQDFSETFTAPWRVGEANLVGKPLKDFSYIVHQASRARSLASEAEQATSLKQIISKGEASRSALLNATQGTIGLLGFASGIPIRGIWEILLGTADLADIL